MVSDDIGQVKHDIEVQIHDLEGDHCRRLGEAAEQVSDRLKANENDNPWPLRTGSVLMRSTAQDGARRARVCPACSDVMRFGALFHHTELRCLCEACNVVQKNADALCLA